MYMIHVNPLSLTVVLVAIYFLSKSFDVTVCLCKNTFAQRESRKRYKADFESKMDSTSRRRNTGLIWNVIGITKGV